MIKYHLRAHEDDFAANVCNMGQFRSNSLVVNFGKQLLYRAQNYGVRCGQQGCRFSSGRSGSRARRGGTDKPAFLTIEGSQNGWLRSGAAVMTVLMAEMIDGLTVEDAAMAGADGYDSRCPG